AYVVFSNRTLEEVARREPATLAELGSIPGVGPAKLSRYGAAILAELRVDRDDDVGVEWLAS
ncbi:MAG: HRDC domain-containing protein, partial [Thermoleophilia bacterium]|nr:HRDC domain-containing protein [Thermoleophilia bacterium]